MRRHAASLALLSSVCALWALGCPRAEQATPSAPASVESAEVVVAPAPSPVASATTTTPTPAPSPSTSVEPTWRGDYCQKDADCGWDDPCAPHRCGKIASPSPVVCDKSAAAPGTCTCIEDMCTLRPDKLSRGDTRGAPSCLHDEDCAIDVATGTCHAKGQSLIGPIHREGPVCVCKPSMGQCALRWVDPIPCASWRDCSWVRQPRLRPVPAKDVPRPVPRKVRPCQDGEIDSVCESDDGRKTCKVVGWSC